jgi:hypothetical protein
MSIELSELFERDPLKLTDQDIDKIVARMREAQAQYELGVKTPVAPRPKAKSTKTQDILKSLGLE